jgi:hypothetical protein
MSPTACEVALVETRILPPVGLTRHTRIRSGYYGADRVWVHHVG